MTVIIRPLRIQQMQDGPAWFISDLVAQLVEQYTFNVWAAGSNPAGITKQYGPVAQTVRATDS